MFVILFDPRGLKRFSRRRLVSGAGDIKLTKDGNVLLHEMVRVDVILWACVILCETPPTLSPSSKSSTPRPLSLPKWPPLRSVPVSLMQQILFSVEC